MWTAPAGEPVDGPIVGQDRAILEAYRDFQQASLMSIGAGPRSRQLATRPSRHDGHADLLREAGDGETGRRYDRWTPTTPNDLARPEPGN